MPGVVAAAAPATVMPHSLCASFTEARSYELEINEYAGGESQRALLAATSRKKFSCAKLLTKTELDALRSFFNARKHAPFYFYSWLEGSHDPTGALTSGRYTVRFSGQWAETIQSGRWQCSIELVEVA